MDNKPLPSSKIPFLQISPYIHLLDKLEEKIRKKLLVINLKNINDYGDLLNWLQEIESILLSGRTISLPNEKIELAKRLAQCLNPTMANMIHKKTLKIYNILLKNLRETKQQNNNDWA